MHNVRRRFWVESGAATLTGVMLVVTALWPDWIELMFKVEPDGGGGELEWLLVGAMALATLTLVLVARMEWVRVGPRGTMS